MVSATIFSFMADHRHDLLSAIGWTLKLFGASFGLAFLIGAPLGVWLGHIRRGAWLAINISNLGRALPSLAVIAILIAPIGLGFTTVMIALVVLAVPVILTNAYVAVAEVDPDLTEAARGMGMTGLQSLWRVELPVALPLFFAGLRTAGLYVMATTTLAAFAGAPGGLGDIIANQASYKFEGVVAASLVIAVLCFAADGLFALLQRYATPGAAGARRRKLDAPGSVLDTP